MERERLAERLELSSREVTQLEEAEWRCLDSTNPTQGWPTPRQVKSYNVLSTGDEKLMLKCLREIFCRDSILVCSALATLPRKDGEQQRQYSNSLVDCRSLEDN